MAVRIIAMFFAILNGLSIVGCSQSAPLSSTSVAAARPEPQPSSAVSAIAEIAETATSSAPALAEAFEPPFPDREDLFNPSTKIAAAPERPETAGDVKLRGFVNVDGVKALLVINGQITPTVAGQQYAGIDVIAIEPPQVTLQRGRVRWTEKLYQ